MNGITVNGIPLVEIIKEQEIKEVSKDVKEFHAIYRNPVVRIECKHNTKPGPVRRLTMKDIFDETLKTLTLIDQTTFYNYREVEQKKLYRLFEIYMNLGKEIFTQKKLRGIKGVTNPTRDILMLHQADLISEIDPDSNEWFATALSDREVIVRLVTNCKNIVGWDSHKKENRLKKKEEKMEEIKTMTIKEDKPITNPNIVSGNDYFDKMRNTFIIFKGMFPNLDENDYMEIFMRNKRKGEK